MRNLCIQLSLTIAFVACSAEKNPQPRTPSDAEVASLAKEIHEAVLTIDSHDDIPLNFATPEVDPGVPGRRQVDIPKMEEGQLDVGFFIVYVGQGPRNPEGYSEAKNNALAKFAAIRRLTEMYPEKIVLAVSPDEVRRANAEGKLVACIGIENGYAMGTDLDLLGEYFDLGARYMTLSHGGHNDICDSATPRGDEPETEHGGLSPFGEEVVSEMNRLGMMVDVSHISKESMLDAVRVSAAPVIASHSGVRAICDHPRNLDDEQLLALKDHGGVIQTVALNEFVKEAPPEKVAAIAKIRQEYGLTSWAAWRNLTEDQRTEYRSRMASLDETWPPATLSDYVDHIDYAVRLIGIDHVGISSDFDGGGGVTGWNDASESKNVTLELVRRGYSEEDITKLWGGNLLRVWAQVQETASGLSGSQRVDNQAQKDQDAP